jgi:hypothetical protein
MKGETNPFKPNLLVKKKLNINNTLVVITLPGEELGELIVKR